MSNYFLKFVLYNNDNVISLQFVTHIATGDSLFFSVSCPPPKKKSKVGFPSWSIFWGWADFPVPSPVKKFQILTGQTKYTLLDLMLARRPKGNYMVFECKAHRGFSSTFILWFYHEISNARIFGKAEKLGIWLASSSASRNNSGAKHQWYILWRITTVFVCL